MTERVVYLVIGSIPSAIGNMSALQNLYLGSNLLVGECLIPELNAHHVDGHVMVVVQVLFHRVSRSYLLCRFFGSFQTN